MLLFLPVAPIRGFCVPTIAHTDFSGLLIFHMTAEDFPTGRCLTKRRGERVAGAQRVAHLEASPGGRPSLGSRWRSWAVYTRQLSAASSACVRLQRRCSIPQPSRLGRSALSPRRPRLRADTISSYVLPSVGSQAQRHVDIACVSETFFKQEKASRPAWDSSSGHACPVSIEQRTQR